MDRKLVKQFEQLLLKAAKPKAAPKRKRKGAAKAVVAPVVQKAQVRKVKAEKLTPTTDGSMRITREEMLVAVMSNAPEGLVVLSPANFPWLKGISANFERFVANSMRIYYKPAVGTATDGLIVYGVDWNPDNGGNTTRSGIQQLTPVNDHPLWQDSRGQPLILPKSRLQTRKEYLLTSTQKSDSSVGYLAYNAGPKTDVVKFYGELWVKYDISFFGTK